MSLTLLVDGVTILSAARGFRTAVESFSTS
jgi:hypothetical protein